MFKYVIVLAILATQLAARPTDHPDPSGVCHTDDDTDFAPQHGGNKGQETDAPYHLEGASSIDAGSTIDLKLKGNNTAFIVRNTSVRNTEFKGFLLQARLDGKNGLPTGTFHPDENSKGFDCLSLGTQNTLTQSHFLNGVSEVNIRWTAPAELKGRQVTFVATVVQDFATFWVKKVTHNVNIN